MKIREYVPVGVFNTPCGALVFFKSLVHKYLHVGNSTRFLCQICDIYTLIYCLQL